MSSNGEQVSVWKWRAAVRVLDVLAVGSGVLVLWAVISFVRYRDFDVGVALMIIFAVAGVLYMRSLAKKRKLAAEHEENT
jgi:hypothetical protein